ncbi:MAG: carbamoyltransferase family protein, partial [Hyphomicrobiaceae bacterium]
GKVMGMAAYGTDALVEKFADLVILKDDGDYALNMDYFCFDIYGEKHPFTRKFYETFGQPDEDCSKPGQHQLDLAFALQAITERTIIHVARGVQEASAQKKLVFTGGVAMNCVANAKILEQTGFDEIWVPPNASDAGVPLGAALYHYHQTCSKPRLGELRTPFHGTEYSDTEIEIALKDAGLSYRKLDEAELIENTADALTGGKIIGWFQGRFEMGPRALGNRSILADPRRKEMKDTINARIKHREGFRPFAPAVLREHASDWFHIDQPDPFMTIAPRVRHEKADKIPAVVHADGTGRFQTVERAINPRYYDLISAFEKRTGVPVLLNTSFNKQEPIVTGPAEAISCYLRTDMDVLVLGNFYVDDRNDAAVRRAKELF